MDSLFEKYKDKIRIESLDTLDCIEIELVVPSDMLEEYFSSADGKVVSFWKVMK